MRKVILIGGSPTAGKSYTARKIADELKMPWISTDTIREQMRKIVREEDHPALFHHAGATPQTAYEFLTKNSAEKIVENQNEESLEVWKGAKAIIETDYVWESFIIEGVAVLPNLVADLIKKNKDIRVFFLIDEDERRVRKTIFKRGLWDDAEKYSDDVKEKEVEWVFAFNEYIKREAKKYNLPVVSIGNRKDYLKNINRIIE